MNSNYNSMSTSTNYTEHEANTYLNNYYNGSTESINEFVSNSQQFFSSCISIPINDSIGMKNIKIKDVEILIPNKVVKVIFDDDSFEKAICHSEDEFNIETAITICIAKHLCGGSGKFNNLVNKGLKILNNKIKAEEEARLEQERIEAKRKRNHEKKIRLREKKENEARNARIQETAEAIKLAHDMINTKSN